METYLIYISKVAIATGAFYLAYLVLFQNRKHFVFNRVYLPVMLALSFIIPLITFTTLELIEAPITEANSFVYFDAPSETVLQPISYSFWPHYLFGIYILGVTGFLFHLITGHIKAILIIRGSRIKHLFGCRIHVTEKDVHPFSFFSRIVISERTLNCRNLKMIVEHEHIHVKEHHTLDILFTEILFLLQWFNPFAWLLKDAVKNNLEYKTDDKIIKDHDPVTYQLAMVALADKKGVAPFLTALNGSQLKSRIIMMKNKNENRFMLLKQLTLLPLLAVLVMGLSDREVKTEFIQKQSSNNTTQPKIKKEIFVSGKVTNQKDEPLKGVPVIIKGQSVGSITDSNGNYKIQLEQDDETLIFTGQEYEKQEIETAGKDKVDVQLKPSRSKNSSQLNPGQSESSSETSVTIKSFDSKNEPLYVVDGKITKTITQVPPEDIEKIDFLKNETATRHFGPDAKHGALLITTKSKSYSYLNENARTVRPRSLEQIPLPDVWPKFPGGEKALKQYIANNISYPESARENGIQGTAHVSFRVTKEGKVTDVRLARGVHHPLDKEALRVVSSMPDWHPAMNEGQPADMPVMTVPVDFVIKNPVVKTSGYAQSIVLPGPLYVVDGEETKSIKDIAPDDIRSIDVLNSASSTALYGQRGKDGVIIITTKKGSTQNKIITKRQLRQFIAEHIKYPAEAQKIGLHGISSTVIDPANSNRVTSVENYTRDEVYNLPGIVVVGYGDKKVKSFDPEKDIPLLLKEVNRVLQMLPEIDIPGLEGKQIGISVEFELQPEK